MVKINRSIIDKRLQDHFAETGEITSVDLSRARALSSAEDIALDRSILNLGLLDEEKLLSHLAKLLGLSWLEDLSDLESDEAALDILTRDYCRSLSVAPVLCQDEQKFLLTNDPSNTTMLEELEFYLDHEPRLIVVPKRLVREMLTANSNDTGDDLDVSISQLDRDIETIKVQSADGPVVRFVTDVIEEAVVKGASDVHFEVQENGLRIRYRIGGLLRNRSVDRSLDVLAVLARVKVLASMNVAERRLPQDGRLRMTTGGRVVDFRVSSVPTSFGESIVCRVLDPNALRLGWGRLGFNAQITKGILEILEEPNGLFLVTGPTGSGKTTTLYTALAHLNHDDRKILTVEDPVEYNLPGIEQVQVREEFGLGFGNALRAFLRQDPNVIMVGEIRDQETAEIACRAALVGRMVLSTLHTNSPEDAETRLVDLGVPKYIVASVLRGVLGQRLEIAEDGKRKLSATLFVPKFS